MNAIPTNLFPPVKGTPPTVEWSRCDGLQIDHGYQRMIEGRQSQRLIKSIAENWDWRLLSPLTVSHRDGRYGEPGFFVIDGQHRLEAARLRGDIASLPCIISKFESYEAEALAFVNINSARRQVTALDRYHARVAAKEELALKIKDVVEMVGLTVTRHNDAEFWAPDEISFPDLVGRYLEREGEQKGETETALGLLVAWCGKPLLQGRELFEGLIHIARSEWPGGHDGFYQDFVDHLASKRQSLWVATRNRIMAEDENLKPGRAMALAFLKDFPGEKPRLGRTRGEGQKRHEVPKPGKGIELAGDHRAVSSGETLFPNTLRDPASEACVLKSGHNNAKIGREVEIGAWKGMPIVTLTLEERKTCPPECKVIKECFAPDTLILKSNLTWSRIDELSEGDRIIGFEEFPERKGKDRTFQHSEVQNLKEVKRDRIILETSEGPITVTKDHQFLVRRKLSTKEGRKGFSWVESGDLRQGDLIQFLCSPWRQDLSYEAGRIRGFVEGEGSVGTTPNNGKKQTRLSWSQVPGQLFDEINEIAQNLGYNLYIRNVISGINSVDTRHADIAGGWREVLRFLGTVRPTRLLQNAEDIYVGHSVKGKWAEFQGFKNAEHGSVYQIKTSTNTLVANGFLSHNCYGNNMQWAQRFKHGPALERKIHEELQDLQAANPSGFVVRLHVLGDFYSLEYVELWERMLGEFPGLRIYGYTAHDPSGEIGAKLLTMACSMWERFAMRFSGSGMSELAASVIKKPEDCPDDSFVCLVEVGKATCCASCAACWESEKNVAFIRRAP